MSVPNTPQTEKNPEPLIKEKPTLLGGVLEAAKHNLGDTIAYIVLLLGLTLTFFHPFYGGFLVGIIMGLYFSRKVFFWFEQFREFVSKEGVFRGFIVIAAIAAFMISAPGICLGLFIGAFARPLFGKNISDQE